ncbi:Lysophospholipase L1 [Clostridium amylolyticum]|uniref:Lysophospholipase L1 n=1 Tax=Clostridium amylolyticum TaxID=1121298 RepID=A0A1M6NQL8_9CLOT|nr:SGNH/GDSL hydrolase family protein [Clostridium amylolyticum]SHJ97940.1 Lysophospholipase L1 [Clostridium amylolyticum]
MSNKGIDAQKLDKNMHIDYIRQEEIKWYSPKESPFKISGFSWFHKDKVYRRLPCSKGLNISMEVDMLANCTSGGQIRFRTQSKKILLKVKLSGIANMVHMPATGQCGFDIYVEKDHKFYYYNTTKYDHTKDEYESVLFEGKGNMWRDILINFPLYQGVEEILIGIESSAKVDSPLEFSSNKKLIFYGTSITQGGCASRPGMSYTNILSRKLNMEVINLGFSGNGKGEPEMAEIISGIENPALLVLDYEPNCVSTQSLKETLPKFINIYRKKHPDIPILVISRPLYALDRFDKELNKERIERFTIQRETVEYFNQKGYNNIYFYSGENLLGEDYEECTVDGIHPTDLGFIKIANALEPIIKKII